MVKTKKYSCRKSWDLRNNSGNVAAVLNPELNMSKHYSRTRSCYCKEKYIAPRLFHKPKDRTFDENIENSLHILGCKDTGVCCKFGKNAKKFLETIKIYNKTNNDNFDKYFDESSYSEEEQSDPISSQTSLSRIPQYEKKYLDEIIFDEGYNSIYPEDHPHLLEDTHYNSLNFEEEKNKIFSNTRMIEQIENTQTDENSADDRKERNTKNSTYKNFENDDSDLKQINEFRKNHYFETHSTEDLIKDIPEHVCVHKFGLDDRMLPLPLNVDSYDISRCIICGKVMDTPPISKVDERIKASKKNNIFPKFYKYGLAPKKIYIGNGKDVRIDMALDSHQIKQCEIAKMKKPSYCNTLALRYQKGA